jgi:hypothetical protein
MLEAALALPQRKAKYALGLYFNPWGDVIHGIHGTYCSESDDLMIEVLEAVRDRTTWDLIERRGFVAEFIPYVLAGHDLIGYGTSPQGGYPEHPDLWQPLIDKWKAYRDIVWADDD